jgi:uncharacterized protein (DUF488 family)
LWMLGRYLARNMHLSSTGKYCRGSLKSAGIEYVRLKELGGFRHPVKDSVDLGRKNTSFRGYADCMQTEEFVRGIERLIAISENDPAVIMCAEAVPWRCYRSPIADALIVRKIGVTHILGKKSSREHKLIPFARVSDTKITYPK